MPNAELTLRLDGTVTLHDFITQLGHLEETANALASELPRAPTLRWVISELDGGTAEAGISAEVETTEQARCIETRYLQVAEYVRVSDPLLSTLPEMLVQPVQRIVASLNGDIKEIHFEAGGGVVDVLSPTAVSQRALHTEAMGAVLGVVETLSSRHRRRFTLYEVLHGEPIRCYFASDLNEQVREAWERYVQVDGWVVRDMASGRPLEVQRVKQISVLDREEPPDFHSAIGVIPWKDGMLTAEKAIRQGRDG